MSEVLSAHGKWLQWRIKKYPVAYYHSSAHMSMFILSSSYFVLPLGSFVGFFFFFGALEFLVKNIMGVWFGFAEEEEEQEEQEGIPISILASLLSKSNSRHRFRREVAGTTNVWSFTSK